MAIHDVTKQGYAQGAKDYVHGRPGYPPETVSWLRDVLEIRPGSRVLDVGSGTGKFIPILEEVGASVVALEPVEAMRRRLVSAFPAVDVLEGEAEGIPLPDESITAILCAQAFHWFATQESLAEFQRVLPIGGMLGLIWNGRDESVPWVRALSDITKRYEGDTPRYRTGQWRKAFTGSNFRPVDERHLRNLHVGPVADVVLRRTLSVSFVAALPAKERSEVRDEVMRLIERTPELSTGKNVAFPYVTDFYAFSATV